MSLHITQIFVSTGFISCMDFCKAVSITSTCIPDVCKESKKLPYRRLPMNKTSSRTQALVH